MQRLHCTACQHRRDSGAKHDERGKMAEATARAASIRRYGEALGDPALAERWVQTSSADVDVDKWLTQSSSTGRGARGVDRRPPRAPAVEAVRRAPPRLFSTRRRPPSVLDKADEERLAKAYADKLLGCDAHDAPAWVRAAAAADDARPPPPASARVPSPHRRAASERRTSTGAPIQGLRGRNPGCDARDAPAWVRAAACRRPRSRRDAAANAPPPSSLEKEDVERGLGLRGQNRV